MKKQDLFLIGGILILALILYGGLLLFGSGEGGKVTVLLDGAEQETYDLNEDLELDLVTPEGTNHLSIRNGVASVTEADCPDKLCVHQKSIQYQGEMIVCLPHKLVIRITGGEEAPLDGVAQ